MIRTVSKISNGKVLRRMSSSNVDPYANLKKLGITLPPQGTPKGSYCMGVKSGNMLFLAGHIPVDSEGKLLTGKVGKDKTLEYARKAASLCALNLISSIENELGDLKKVKRIVKVVGFVNCTDEFKDHPQVINACSDLMFEIFESKGIHARSAVGTNALPLGVTTEIEAIIEFET